MAHAAGSLTALGKALNLPMALLIHLGTMLPYPREVLGNQIISAKSHQGPGVLERLLCMLRWVLGVSVSLGWLGIRAMGKLQSSCWSPSLCVKVSPGYSQ